jgi:putative heme iron utilization protein
MTDDKPNPDDIVIEARALLDSARQGVLCTNSAATPGWPFASLVTLAADLDGAPLLLLSGLAVHSRNLAADNRVSLFIEDRSGLSDPAADPLLAPRLTLTGRLHPGEEAARARFVARHPYAFYAEFSDFRMWRLEISEGHFIAGFGRIHRISATRLLDPARLA